MVQLWTRRVLRRPHRPLGPCAASSSLHIDSAAFLLHVRLVHMSVNKLPNSALVEYSAGQAIRFLLLRVKNAPYAIIDKRAVHVFGQIVMY